MKRILLILLTLVMFNFLNCTNTQQEYENIFNNNENNTTQDKTEEEEEIQKEAPFLNYAQKIFISAKTGQNVEDVLEAIVEKITK